MSGSNVEPFQNPLLGCRSGVVANGPMSGGRFRTVVSLMTIIEIAQT